MTPRERLELFRQLEAAKTRGDKRAQLDIYRQLKAATPTQLEVSVAPPGTEAPPIFPPQAPQPTPAQGPAPSYENDVPWYSKWFDRATASFKDSPRTVAAMVNERHPGHHAEVDPATGEVVVNGHPFDPVAYTTTSKPPEDWGSIRYGGSSRTTTTFAPISEVLADLPNDVADLANPILQGAGQAAVLASSGGISLPALLGKEFITGVATEGVSQLIGDTTAGGQEMGTWERLGRQGFSGAINAVTGGIGHFFRSPTKRLAAAVASEVGVPESIAKNEAFEAAMNAGAKEGEKLVLTPQQLLESGRVQNWVEALPDVNTSKTMRKFEGEVQQPSNEAWFKKQFETPVDGVEAAGNTVDRVRGVLKDTRSRKSDKYFNTAREMFGDDVVQTPHFDKARKLEQPSGGMKLDAIQDQLEELGYKTSKGDTDAAYQFRKLLKDLEEASGSTEIGAKILKEGRRLYREFSGPINDLDKQQFVKRLKKILPEQKNGDLLSALASTKNDKALKKFARTIADHNAIASDALADDVMREILDKSMKDGAIDFGAFHAAATSGFARRNLRTLFGQAPGRLKFYEDMVEAARLLKDSTGQLADSMPNAEKSELLSPLQEARRGAQRAGLGSLRDLRPVFTKNAFEKILQDPTGKGQEFVALVKEYAKNPAKQNGLTALAKFFAQLEREQNEGD